MVMTSSPSLQFFLPQDSQLPRCASAANRSTLPPFPISKASTRLALLVGVVHVERKLLGRIEPFLVDPAPVRVGGRLVAADAAAARIVLAVGAG